LAAIRLPFMFSLEGRIRVVAIRAADACVSGLSELARDCTGAVAAEFLIILGPLLLLLLGTFDIGIATLTETRINFAVEAAAKCGAVSAAMCTSPSQTAAYGASVAALRGLDASGFSVTMAACGIYVAASYAYSGVVLPVLTLNAAACYPTG
jgi:Flp pilus assembly protein TadG